MAELIASLRVHAPFDEMEPAALEFLARHLALGYHPRGALVVGPESGAVDRLYIVKQGGVRGSGGAADVLGMKPTTLDSRMAKLGIRRPR